MKKNNKLLFTVCQMLVDAAIVFLAYFGTVFFSVNGDDAYPIYMQRCFSIASISAVIHICVFFVFKIYKTIWRFFGNWEAFKIVVASFISSAIAFLFTNTVAAYIGLDSYATIYFLPRRIFVITPFVISILVFLSRTLFKIYADKTKIKRKSSSGMSGNILIIGAGVAGSMLVHDMATNENTKNAKIVGIIDDDPAKQGMYVYNVKVKGNRNDIVRIAAQNKVNEIIFAIPDCPPEEKAKILKIAQQTGCVLKTMPAVYQLKAGNVGADTVRKVEIEDLLGREPIKIDIESVINYVSGKVVMVTGGGGSIGSELCRQLASHNPKQLIIFDIYENNAYDIQNELKRNYPQLDLVTLIGSVRDSKRIDAVFNKYRPEIVYHAAAHKHVPLMEDSPNEAVKNNVIGTLKTVRAADKYGTKRFVLISTDKAVNPTSVMGATKRICEMIVQTYNRRSNTEYVAVRFGNVLGSNGSVIPLFKRQIEEGGPVTVTHPDIIRYFMTIPEAVSLVLQAGATAKGGEIFVLDMGKPVKILELAENLIRLSGYIPYTDIDIKFTGLRPGEKLYEELLMSEEGLTDTENELIHIGKPIDINEEEFLTDLEEISKVMYDDTVDIRALIKKIVPTCIFSEPEKEGQK